MPCDWHMLQSLDLMLLDIVLFIMCIPCVLLVVREENAITPVKFTYTPLHGVGQKFVEAAFEAFNFPPLISVPEQVKY